MTLVYYMVSLYPLNKVIQKSQFYGKLLFYQYNQGGLI